MQMWWTDLLGFSSSFQITTCSEVVSPSPPHRSAVSPAGTDEDQARYLFRGRMRANNQKTWQGFRFMPLLPPPDTLHTHKEDITSIPTACGSVTCTLGGRSHGGWGSGGGGGCGGAAPHWLLSGDPLYILDSGGSQQGMLLIADHAHNNVACEASEFRQPAGFDATSNWPR